MTKRIVKPAQAANQHKGAYFWLTLFLVLIIADKPKAQTQNADFERIKLIGTDKVYAGLALSPDGKTLAISTKKMQPIRLVDIESQQIIKEINAGSWYPGSRLNYSQKGTYLLVQELGFYDMVENKRRKINFELVEVSGGRIVKAFEAVQDVVISHDEKFVASLAGDEITLWSLPDLNKVKTIKISTAADAIALSPDNKTVVVSHTVSPAALKADPAFRKQKKAAKLALKYKQQISFYNVETAALLQTLNNLYDIIYRLRYSDDGSVVFVFQLPHLKVMTSKQPLAYVNMADAVAMKPMRRGLTSQAVGQPDIRLSHDGKLFAINSKGKRFQEIHLYDYETGTLHKRFELGQRFFEKSSEGDKLIRDSRPSFVFLPGDQSILVAMGNQLVVWNINEE